MSRVLGLDQSTNVNGFCLYDGSIIEYGKIEIKKICPNGEDYIDRIIELIRILAIQFDEFNPDTIGLEEVTLQQDSGLGRKKNTLGSRGFKTFAKLTENIGNIKVLSRVKNINFVTVYPSEWRSHYGICKERSRAKIEAVDIVNDKFKLDLEYGDDDIAEAILIAKYIYDTKK